jgi:hypothetical protein
MVLSKESFQTITESRFVEEWRDFIDTMEESATALEKGLGEAGEMREACTLEWCEAMEQVIEELDNALFFIGEYSWASEADSRKIKKLKGRLNELYARYKSAAT